MCIYKHNYNIINSRTPAHIFHLQWQGAKGCRLLSVGKTICMQLVVYFILQHGLSAGFARVSKGVKRLGDSGGSATNGGDSQPENDTGYANPTHQLRQRWQELHTRRRHGSTRQPSSGSEGPRSGTDTPRRMRLRQSDNEALCCLTLTKNTPCYVQMPYT